MGSPETELAGCSSGLIRLAKERQRSGPYKDLTARYEEKEGENGSSSEEWLKANPRGYYEIRGENLTVKGNQFAEMVLPVNAKETNPSLGKKISKLVSRRLEISKIVSGEIKINWRLLKEKLFG
jgi:hypothetical protein